MICHIFLYFPGSHVCPKIYRNTGHQSSQRKYFQTLVLQVTESDYSEGCFFRAVLLFICFLNTASKMSCTRGVMLAFVCFGIAFLKKTLVCFFHLEILHQTSLFLVDTVVFCSSRKSSCTLESSFYQLDFHGFLSWSLKSCTRLPFFLLILWLSVLLGNLPAPCRVFF